MSRWRSGGGDYSDYWQLDAGRWEVNLARVATSKRGKVMLRELEAALLALPEKKLLEGMVADGDGHFCSVGALVAYQKVKKGESDWLKESIDLKLEYNPEWYLHPMHDGTERVVRLDPEDGSLSSTAEMATSRTPITWTLAWLLAEQNDIDFGHCTEEERYEKVLAWVREKLAA